MSVQSTYSRPRLLIVPLSNTSASYNRVRGLGLPGLRRSATGAASSPRSTESAAA